MPIDDEIIRPFGAKKAVERTWNERSLFDDEEEPIDDPALERWIGEDMADIVFDDDREGAVRTGRRFRRSGRLALIGD